MNAEAMASDYVASLLERGIMKIELDDVDPREEGSALVFDGRVEVYGGPETELIQIVVDGLSVHYR